MHKIVSIAAFLAIFLCLAVQADAQSPAKKFTKKFASLRSAEVNSRTGPGMRYPIDWVYQRRDLPIEVLDEYEVWRKFVDKDGNTGWVHQSMISSRRYGIIKEKAELFRSAEKGLVVAHIEPEVIVKIIACKKDTDSCRVEVKGKHGFIIRDKIWGLYPDEFF